MQDGPGKEELEDGSKYDGMFKNGKACGKGKFVNAEGDVFEGNFEDNRAMGEGVYQLKGFNMVFEGTWKKD